MFNAILVLVKNVKIENLSLKAQQNSLFFKLKSIKH